MVWVIGFINNGWVLKMERMNFNTIRLHWTDHPERTEEWRKEQDKILGPSQACSRM